MANQQAALLQRKAAYQKQGEDIFAQAEAAGRDLTDDERTALADLKAKVAVSQKDIELHEAFRREERNAPAASNTISNATDLGAAKAWGADWGADKILADDKASPRAKERARNIVFGEELVARYKAATGQGFDPRLLAAVPGLGQNETIGPDGGYLVSQTVSTDMNIRIWGGEILSRVRRIGITSGANSMRINYLLSYSGATGSRHGGARAYWLEEGATKTPSQLAFDFWQATLHKIAGLAYATDEVLADVGALGSLIFEALSAEIRFEVESAVFGGNGIGKPLGFANVGNPSLITVSAEGGQGAATVLWENIAKIYMRMYPPSRSNAVWLVNQDVEYQLSTMTMAVGVGGVPVWMPAGGIAGSPNSTLYGRPIITTDFSPTLGTVGDIVFADLSQYFLIEKGGIATDSSIHVAFVTDETCFRAVMRVDGQPGWKTVLTPAQGSNTTSPFVALATRA